MPEFSAEQKLSRGIEIGSLATYISTGISGLHDCSRDFISSLVSGYISQEDYPRNEDLVSPGCLALSIFRLYS